MAKNGADPPAAAGAAILDRLMKIEDHVGAIREMIEAHTAAAVERQRAVLAAIQAADETTRYYGGELVSSYHHLERLYRRLDEQLRTIDNLELSLAAPPAAPASPEHPKKKRRAS